MKKINKYQFGNLITMPLYLPKNSEGGKKQREILSYLPITDVAVDMENAIDNPTFKNIATVGVTGAMNFLGGKYLKYLTKGSREIKQMAKQAKDKYDELLKLYRQNQESLVRSRSTREEALKLKQQASDAFSDYNTYNNIKSIVQVPEYFLYSIWPALDAGINKVQNEKQGGKMNLIDFLKNGSGIHIKKKNRGKFTDYCGGKVTSECIAKGKSSPNPAIRKRATFAANARKWKHQDGGVLMFLQQGDKIDWGGLATNALTSGLQTYQQIKQNNEAINQQIQLNKEQKKNPMQLMTQYLQKIQEDNLRKKQAIEALGSTVNFNPDIDKHFAYQLANQDVAEENQNIDEQNKLLDTYRKAQNTQALTNFGLGLLQTGMNAGLQYLANKKNSTNNSATA